MGSFTEGLNVSNTLESVTWEFNEWDKKVSLQQNKTVIVY